MVLLCGLAAGLAILPGMLLGRRARAGGGAFRWTALVGILLFLVWDLLTHGFEPIGSAIEAYRDEMDPAEPVVTLSPRLLIGIVVGFGVLTWHAAALHLAHPEYGGLERDPAHAAGPGAMAATEAGGRLVGARARRLALFIAAGIGMQGLLGGLALGASGGHGEIAFTILLAAGLALLNGLEGYRLAEVFAGGADRRRRPSPMLALLAGGPLLAATAMGLALTEKPDLVAVQGLAAGALLHTAIRLLIASGRRGHRPRLYAGVVAGMTTGFLANILVITFAGSID